MEARVNSSGKTSSDLRRARSSCCLHVLAQERDLWARIFVAGDRQAAGGCHDAQRRRARAPGIQRSTALGPLQAGAAP